MKRALPLIALALAALWLASSLSPRRADKQLDLSTPSLAARSSNSKADSV